jgi:succinoglycan biosynthesis protein ExoU
MIADRSTAVIITAKDAQDTASKAVASALAQAVVSEVVFVDDGSRDDTSSAALAADDGSGRLKLIRLPENRGPARGRNVAIEASTAPFLCILDADDFMTPGRLQRLFDLGGRGWDLLADDLLFCDGPDETRVFDRLLPGTFEPPHDLTLSEFGLGNLPRRERPRRELGFLKPVIRRSFLDAHAIRYDERLRLGEDLLVYARCLLAGARFRLVEACGYCAVQRGQSLSAHHATQDVANLYAALLEFAEAAARSGRPIGGLVRYIRSTRNNLALRRALDGRRERGWRGLLQAMQAAPESLPYVLGRIARDKAEAALRGRGRDQVRAQDQASCDGVGAEPPVAEDGPPDLPAPGSVLSFPSQGA